MSVRQAVARASTPFRALRAASTTAQPTASTSAAVPPPAASSPPSPAAPAPHTLTRIALVLSLRVLVLVLLVPAGTHGVHVATLHLRSYTDAVPDLQFFTQFALRAARALGLPTSGAVALPTRTSLYTVPRSPFAHKKSQQNFWRKEHKRAIKVWDGNPAVVDAWLAYLRREALGGVGMKAQVFTYRDIGWGKDLVSQQESDAHALAQYGHGGESGAAEVERLADELEQELQAGIDKAEQAESAADIEAQPEHSPVEEAAVELKEAQANGEDVDGKEVPVKGA
ncbi:hypothetical protein JCM3770_006797 [Rhodotorula araucariae]